MTTQVKTRKKDGDTNRKAQHAGPAPAEERAGCELEAGQEMVANRKSKGGGTQKMLFTSTTRKMKEPRGGRVTGWRERSTDFKDDLEEGTDRR